MLNPCTPDANEGDRYVVVKINVTRLKRLAHGLVSTAKGVCILAGGSGGAIGVIGWLSQR